MKPYLFTLALIGLAGLTTFAQDNNKLRKDVTYSVHNYKHGNKAAVARTWSDQKAVSVPAPGTVAGPIANYKHPMPGTQPSAGVTVEHTPEMDVAVRNYKMQGASTSAQPKSEMATKDKKTTVTTGND